MPQHRILAVAATFFLTLASPAATIETASEVATLLQLVDYVGVDYREAVAGGEVVDEGEYAEMVEFAARIREGVAALDASAEKAGLEEVAGTLVRLVDGRAAPAEVGELTRSLRDAVLRSYPVALTPKRAPDLIRAAALYRDNCAQCHGSHGRGDGLSAPGQDPPPTDFHDASRARQRSLYGLYNTITLGVDGTAMPGFSVLPEDDRWALAFYVGSLFVDDDLLASGEAASRDKPRPSLRETVTLAPAELDAAGPNAAAVATWLRVHPELLFDEFQDPIEVALSRIEASAAAYAAGDVSGAQSLAVSAYLDGFELAEAALGATEPELVREVEAAMMGFRNAAAAGAPPSEIEGRSAEVVGLLRRAERALDERDLSSGVAFTSAFVILLREGLEAVLVLGAMVALLIRTGRQRALAYLHYGWLAALAAGVATWMLATWVVELGGAAREVTEGATALVAAGVLFYVGFWMHDKTNAQRWSRYLDEHLQRALGGGTLLGISAVAFVAVYREVFETVLFYQALWPQVGANGHGALLGGAGTAAVTLVVIAWAVFRFGVRLPLRPFFAISALLMFALAVIFAGKGVVALQEAGKLPTSPIEFPRIELLGIYPSLESLAAQLLLGVAALALIWWNRRAVTATTS